MTKIVITIEVEGGNVSVKQGQTSTSSDSKPFVQRPDPEFPSWDPACHAHDLEWVLQPAGVSNTKVDEHGNKKRYNAFWKCPERGCNERPEWKPKDDDEMGF